MNSGRPRIGVTWPNRGTSIPDLYLRAIESAGGIPVLIRPDDGADTISSVDALLLPGGVDIDPKHYREEMDERVAQTVEVDEERDALELEALRGALERGLPVLGICRGVQVLNAGMGGTLWQDLSLADIDVSAHYQSRRRPRPADWEAIHDVHVEPGTQLARILGEGRLPVNSFHHQAPARPAPGLRVAARSADGLIEALESSNHRFVLGVQWHPERMVEHVPVQRKLFAALVKAARRD